MAIAAKSVDEMYETLRDRLRDIVPEFELEHKAEIAWQINRLKEERGAIILGHNYMEPALFHSVCDVKGDSLELARKAAEAEADPIVFCGVRFMAETAKILNPTRTVLLPAEKAGCSLAESITGDDVRRLKERYPGVPVVTYINTYADVKAESDVCCTSSNAARVVESLDADTVIFIPDEYLARNVARETGKRVLVPSVGAAAAPTQITPNGTGRPRGSANGASGPRIDGGGDGTRAAGDGAAGEGEAADAAGLIGWPGRCEVHEQFTVGDIADVRKQFPDVVVLAHPECSPEVVDAADFSGSTSAMIGYVKDVEAPRYLLLTECSMGDNIVAETPDREMVRLCSVRCPHMNEITLEQTLDALREDKYVVDVREDVRVRALDSITRMLEIG